LGAQTYWRGHPLAILQGVNYDVHGWVGFVYMYDYRCSYDACHKSFSFWNEKEKGQSFDCPFS
jgi:hypothetical protein